MRSRLCVSLFFAQCKGVICKQLTVMAGSVGGVPYQRGYRHLPDYAQFNNG